MQLLKNSRVIKKQFSPWLIWGLGAAFFFVEYFARVAPSVMVSDLMRDFAVDALALGTLSAFFHYAYVSMQVPVGILVDRYGAHRLLTVMCFLCGLGCLLFAAAKSVWIADLGRLLMGFGAAFAFVGSLKLAAVWFPASRFGLLAGLTQALGMLGAAVGSAPMSFAVYHLGWRMTMLLIAGIFLLLAIFIGFIVRDKPANASLAHEPLASDKNVLAGLVKVLSNPQSWWNALYAGLIYAPTAAVAELWGVTFVRQAYHLSLPMAATAVSLIFIGWGVGGPITGWFSDKIQRRRPIMFVSAFMCLAFFLLILYLPSHTPMGVLFVVMFFYGVSNTGLVASYALAGEINPRRIAGTSVAFANMASVIIGAFFQPLIGWVLDLNWHGEMANGAPIYSPYAFRLAFLIIPICLGVCCFITFFIKETYCQSVESRESHAS